jgi:glutamate synthase domain-containing protein 3
VVVLGDVGRNFGAGMSGGEAYVHDPAGTLPLRLNDDLVGFARVHAEAELRSLVERHVRYTGSELGAGLLEAWDDALGDFWHVTPKAEVASIEEEHEGTGTGAVQETEEATAG